MALEKFYIVYGIPKDGVKDWRGNNRTFTKSDVEWFGVDEKMALQRFKSLARRCGESYTPYMKCVDLESLPDYTTTKPSDDLIAEINKKVVGPLNSISSYWIHTRATTNKDGQVTFSITNDIVDEAKPDYYGRANLSVCHNSKFCVTNIERNAFNNVLEILVDKYIKKVNITVPLKLRINKKDYLKLKPTEK